MAAGQQEANVVLPVAAFPEKPPEELDEDGLPDELLLLVDELLDEVLLEEELLLVLPLDDELLLVEELLLVFPLEDELLLEELLLMNCWRTKTPSSTGGEHCAQHS